MRFKDYKHFTDYCLKMADNKKYIVSIDERDSLVEFKDSYILLERLKEKSIIEFRKNMLNILVYYFDDGQIFNAFRYMKTINKSQKKLLQGSINIYDYINNINNTIRMDIQFNEDYIFNGNKETVYYPNRLDVYRVLNDTFEAFVIDEVDIGKKKLNRSGIFYIYNKDNELVYIGDTIDCVLKSSFQFIDNNKMYDFSKIEIYYTNTYSDGRIYKYYYVGKHKPILNGDEYFNDELTIQIDDLKPSKAYVRHDNNIIKYKYKYFIKETVTISEYLQQEENLYLYNGNNKNLLLKDNINYKSLLLEDLIKKAVKDAEKKNKIVATEYWK